VGKIFLLQRFFHIILLVLLVYLVLGVVAVMLVVSVFTALPEVDMTPWFFDPNTEVKICCAYLEIFSILKLIRIYWVL